MRIDFSLDETTKASAATEATSSAAAGDRSGSVATGGASDASSSLSAGCLVSLGATPAVAKAEPAGAEVPEAARGGVDDVGASPKVKAKKKKGSMRASLPARLLPPQEQQPSPQRQPACELVPPQMTTRATPSPLMPSQGKEEASGSVPVRALSDLGIGDFTMVGSDEGDEEDGDVWLLLGLPWREGFLAIKDGDGPASDCTHDSSAWRRMWCVAQDSSISLFEHQRAADSCAATGAVEVLWDSVAQMSLDSTCSGFYLKLKDGRQIELRPPTRRECVEWVGCLLQVFSWRAVQKLQSVTSPEWENIRVRQ